MSYSETQNARTALRASCVWALNSLVSHNECSRSKKAQGKKGRESGQTVGMFKKCISDPYHEIKVLISASLHLTVCYRKELTVSHPERLSL